MLAAVGFACSRSGAATSPAVQAAAAAVTTKNNPAHTTTHKTDASSNDVGDIERAPPILHDVLLMAIAGSEVGRYEITQVPTREGFRFSYKSALSMQRGSNTISLGTAVIADVAPDLTPIRYQFLRHGRDGEIQSEGKVEEQILSVETKQFGTTVKNQYPLQKDMIFSVAGEVWIRQNLRDGFTGTRSVFVEEMGAPMPMTIQVARYQDEKEPKAAWRVIQKFMEMESIDVRDTQGNLLWSHTPAMQMTVYPVGRPPPEGDFAQRAAAPMDLLQKSIWPTSNVPERAKQVVFRIYSKNAASLSIPEDDRQHIIARNAESVDVEVNVGVSQKQRLDDEQKRRFLQETIYEPINDPRLRSQAERVVEGITDTRQKISKMVHFVDEHIAQKSLDRGYATALATLESRSGDCTEHSVLLSALLRAIGIPTRIVDGVIAFDDNKGTIGGSVGYHEWVEAYVEGEGFIAADAAFAAFPAGPERLKMAEGASDPEGRLRLGFAAARLLGDVQRVEVLTWKRQ